MIVEGTLILMLLIELFIAFRIGRTNRHLRLLRNENLQTKESNITPIRINPTSYLANVVSQTTTKQKKAKEPPRELQYKEPCSQHQYKEDKGNWTCVNCGEGWS